MKTHCDCPLITVSAKDHLDNKKILEKYGNKWELMNKGESHLVLGQCGKITKSPKPKKDFGVIWTPRRLDVEYKAVS